MGTEKTSERNWDKPVFPSDNAATELETLFDQIDSDVGYLYKHSTSFVLPHTKWASGISNEEIHRISLQAGEQLEVHRLETKFKSGGTTSGFNVDVYDATAATQLASTSNVVKGNPIGTSGAGNVILIRLTNSTGSNQTASITANMDIIE